jgi:hypothetical protein
MLYVHHDTNINKCWPLHKWGHFFGRKFNQCSDLHWFQCGSGSISRVLLTKKIAIYLSSDLHKGRPIYRGLQPSKRTLSTTNMKFFLLSLWVILPSWIRIQPTKINANPCRFGSKTLNLTIQKIRITQWTALCAQVDRYRWVTNK